MLRQPWRCSAPMGSCDVAPGLRRGPEEHQPPALPVQPCAASLSVPLMDLLHGVACLPGTSGGCYHTLNRAQCKAERDPGGSAVANVTMVHDDLPVHVHLTLHMQFRLSRETSAPGWAVRPAATAPSGKAGHCSSSTAKAWPVEQCSLSPTYSTSFGAFPSFVSEAGDTRLWDRSTVTVAFRRKCTASIACMLKPTGILIPVRARSEHDSCVHQSTAELLCRGSAMVLWDRLVE